MRKVRKLMISSSTTIHSRRRMMKGSMVVVCSG
jgi:hypothetical protein